MIDGNQVVVKDNATGGGFGEHEHELFGDAEEYQR